MLAGALFGSACINFWLADGLEPNFSRSRRNTRATRYNDILTQKSQTTTLTPDILTLDIDMDLQGDDSNEDTEPEDLDGQEDTDDQDDTGSVHSFPDSEVFDIYDLEE